MLILGHFFGAPREVMIRWTFTRTRLFINIHNSVASGYRALYRYLLVQVLISLCGRLSNHQKGVDTHRREPTQLKGEMEEAYEGELQSQIDTYQQKKRAC